MTSQHLTSQSEKNQSGNSKYYEQLFINIFVNRHLLEPTTGLTAVGTQTDNSTQRMR
jgi:hypothetical protein